MRLKKYLKEGMGFVQKLDQKKSGKKPTVEKVPDLKTDVTQTYGTEKNLMKAVEEFVKLIQNLINQDYKKNYPSLKPDKITWKKGGRYIKLIRTVGSGSGSSVHAFIDAKGSEMKGNFIGDIFKPASWRAPAKHRRGNVFVDKGIGAIDTTGSIKYMR